MTNRRRFLAIAAGISMASHPTHPAASEQRASVRSKVARISPTESNGPMLVNGVTGLNSPFAGWWDAGGRSFANSVNARYALIENGGSTENLLAELQACLTANGSNIVFNFDLGTEYSAHAIADLCTKNQIYFVTQGLVLTDVTPWTAGRYYVAHIGDDHEAAGFMMGQALLSSMKTRDCVLALCGPKDNRAAVLRRNGLERALAREQVTVKGEGFAEWQPAQAYDNVRLWHAMFQERISGIWAANDVMALGAIEALRVSRLSGTIPVTGIDGDPDAIPAIRRGELLSTVPRDAFYGGGLGLALARAAKVGAVDPAILPNTSRQFSLALDVVNSQNVAAYAHYRAAAIGNVNWKDYWVKAAAQ